MMSIARDVCACDICFVEFCSVLTPSSELQHFLWPLDLFSSLCVAWTLTFIANDHTLGVVTLWPDNQNICWKCQFQLCSSMFVEKDTSLS